MVALTVVARDGDSRRVEHELVTKGAVDLSSVEAGDAISLLQGVGHCDNIYG